MYVELASGVTANDLYEHLKSTYEVCLPAHVGLTMIT
jgi:hypothetical protein